MVGIVREAGIDPRVMEGPASFAGTVVRRVAGVRKALGVSAPSRSGDDQDDEG